MFTELYCENMERAVPALLFSGTQIAIQFCLSFYLSEGKSSSLLCQEEATRVPCLSSPVACPNFLSEEWQLESTKAVAEERGDGGRRKQLHGRVGSLQLIVLIFLSPVLTIHQEGFKVS